MSVLCRERMGTVNVMCIMMECMRIVALCFFLFIIFNCTVQEKPSNFVVPCTMTIKLSILF